MRFKLILLFALFPVLLFAEPDSVASLQEELTGLEAELESLLRDEVALANREAYVAKVLDLRDRIEALEASPEAAALAAGTDRRTYKLVKVEGHEYPGESYQFNRATMTFSAGTRPDLASKTWDVQSASIGFEQFPKTIVLGEDFTFIGSMVQQHDVKSMRCRRSYGQKQSFFAKQHLYVSGKEIEIHKAKKIVKPGCEGDAVNSASFGLGLMVKGGLHCSFVGTEKTVYLNYKYDCSPVSVDGEIFRDEEYGKDGIELSWKVEKNDSGEWITQSDFANRHELTVRLGGVDSVAPREAITLLYQADYKNDFEPQGGGTVQHTVAINNTVGELGTQLADARDDEQADSDTVAVKAPGGITTTSSSSEQQSGSGLLPSASLDDTNQWVTYWLANAEPIENARTGYDLRFDEWGRVQGKAPNGTITLGSAPEGSAGMPATLYALSRGAELDSLNLCTLVEFVNRKMKGQGTDDCVKTPSGNTGSGSRQAGNKEGTVPDFVGVKAATAKSDLQRLGLVAHWKAGSNAPDQSLAGTIEKQDPAAGSAVEAGAGVALWVYRASTSEKKVYKIPSVIGLSIAGAEAKLRAAGFTPKRGEDVANSNASKEGMVTQQYPTSGTTVSVAGTTASYYAYGKAKIRVPDLAGKSREEALRVLRESGLRASVKTGEPALHGFGDKVGTVYSMRPPALTRVASNSVVTLIVWDKMAPAPKLKPRPTPKPKPKPRYIPPPRRIPPQPVRQPRKQQPAGGSGYVNPNIPARFNCETGLGIMPQNLKKNWLSSKAGQGGLDWTFRERGMAYYNCQHTVRTPSGGTKSRSVNVYWYVRRPQPGSSYFRQFQQYCAEAKRDGYGNGRAIRIFMNDNQGIKGLLGAQNAQRVFAMHSNQMYQYAAPCS